MTDYIDIDDLPTVTREGKWVALFEEWGNIPPGKALEITGLLKGKANPSGTATSINASLTRRNITGIRTSVRSGRLFIINEAKA